MNRSTLANKIAGWLLPLPIFLDPGSSILISNSALTESQLALPISIVALPVLLLLNPPHKTALKSNSSKYYNLFFTSYFFAVAILIFYSATLSLKAAAYGIQWLLPFFWFYYFVSLKNQGDIEKFFNSFATGTLIGAGYTSIAGILEITLHGALLDAGRMTQNLVLPGHYQLYVYIPTALAFNAIISIAAIKWDIIPHKKGFLILLLAATAPALIFTGAREGILIFVVGLIGMFLIKSSKALILISAILAITVSATFLNIDTIQNNDVLNEIRLVNKLLDIREEGRAYGGRDEMAGLYLQVVKESPYIGTAMLPPSMAFPKLQIDAPSAHNYYIDTLAWGGIFLLSISLPFLVFIGLKSTWNIIKNIGVTNSQNRFLATISMLALMFLLISNSLNVPLRQPLTGPIFVLLTYWLLVGKNTYQKIKSSPIR